MGLTRRQTIAVAVLSAAVALTRLAAAAREPWEWDEILFASALRDYDVVFHRPHPPGFPLFVGAAKLLTLLGAGEFRALQAVSLAGAMLLFPLTFALGRALRFGIGVSLGGALILAFAPNVWYYGGTAFSDVPALALVLAASALLLRSDGFPKVSYVAGCAVAGMAIAIRPQLALVLAVPLILSVRARGVRKSMGGLLLAAVIVFTAYAGAILASSSFREYVDVVREQQEYVARVDSFQSPTRPPLPSLLREFFKPTRGVRLLDKLIPLLAALGAAASLMRRSAGAWALLLMFAPLALFSWLMLDLNASSRYVIAYAPMFALLAAYAIESLALPFGRRWREILPAACGAAMAIWFAAGAWESLRQVREAEPPLLRALRSVDRGATIYAMPEVVPFAAYYLPGQPVEEVARKGVESGGFIVAASLSGQPCARNFIARRGKLAEIARARYFEASVVPSGGCQ